MDRAPASLDRWMKEIADEKLEDLLSSGRATSISLAQ